MQSHIQSSHHKRPGNIESEVKPESKIRKIMENILEKNSIKKRLIKSNSFSYHKISLNDKGEKEIVIINKNKEKEKKISNNIFDGDNEIISNKKSVRKNFILKSEIFNLDRDIKNYSMSVSKIKKKSSLGRGFDKYAKTHKESKNNNNNLINIQLIESNRIKVNNNIFQNYPGNNFQRPLYQYYSGSSTSNLNQYYNYNKMNTKYSNRYYNYNINRKNYIHLAKTQTGCKFLQENILIDNKFANDILYQEIKNNLREISLNIFGASTLGVLLKILRYDNLNSFITLLKDDINDICLTEPGSHVVQSLISNILEYPLLLNKFIFYLNNKDIKAIFLSPYGNQVIKYFLSVVKNKELTNFIYKYVYTNFIDIVKEKYGVCIIQKCLSEGDESTKKKILNLIEENIEFIMLDKFGNYLIQYIFIKCININFELLLPLINKIEEKIVFYCQFKYSAAAIEKCFDQGDDKIREHIINFLLEKHSSDIIYISANQFGFYVIKKSFNIKNIETKKEILKIIKRDINKLNSGSKEIKLVYSLLKEFKEYL